MPRKKTIQEPPAELQQALDWLAGPPSDDPLLDLVPLRGHVSAIAALGLPVLHRLKIDELLQQRAERIDQALTPMLLDVKLPLPLFLGTIAQGLIGLRAELGETWMKVATDATPQALARIHRSRAQVCLQGIYNLYRQFLATLLVAAPTPLRFWRNVQDLFHHAYESVDPTSTLPLELAAIEGRFKAMLALTAAQPEGLAAREIAFLAEYLEANAVATRIDPVNPDEEGEWFWLDAALDQPPVPLARLRPHGDRCLYIHFGKLANLAEQHLEQLDGGMPPRSLGLPVQAAGADYRNALARARQSWNKPRQRGFKRRKHSISVSVCTQLSSLWSALSQGGTSDPVASECELTFSDWLTLNESPSGYAIVHVVGEVTGIVPGCAIGLRTGVGAPWQICLVRWARSRGSVQLELGLEVLAPSASPIRIQTQAPKVQTAPVPALLLPALPGLKRDEAILVGRGDHNLRPFTLLQELNGHLRIVECRPHRTLIETSSVEIFEFSRGSGKI